MARSLQLKSNHNNKQAGNQKEITVTTGKTKNIMSTDIQKVEKKDGVEFVPFGAQDRIKLNVKIIQNLVAAPTASGKTCTERDAINFMMLCQAQKLNPFAGDAFLVGYDGNKGPKFSLITAHQAFLKRAETCADYEGMESGVIILLENSELKEREGDFHLSDETVVGGWARVFRKGRKPTYRRIRMERFNSGFAQWKVDAAGMIVKCAEADALRSTFPTLLGGLYNEGEIINVMTERTTVEAPAGNLTLLASPAEDGAGEGNGVELPPIGSPEKQTPQQELAAAITGAGFTFEDFRAWGIGSGNVTEAGALKDFGDIKANEATRLLRGRAGILKALEAAKGGAQ